MDNYNYMVTSIFLLETSFYMDLPLSTFLATVSATESE